MAVFASAVPAVMRLPLPRVASLIVRPPRRRAPSPDHVERLERLVALAPRVAGPAVPSGCLTRGVTLFWFLRRAGLDVELQFGIAPTDAGSADGHCWLSLGGEPFLEKVDPRPLFVETYRLPLAG
jgi:Transglutaminase-like superfamily